MRMNQLEMSLVKRGSREEYKRGSREEYSVEERLVRCFTRGELEERARAR